MEKLVSTRYVQEIMDSMDGGVAVFDSNFCIICCNDYAVKISQLSEKHWSAGTDVRHLLKLGIDFGVYRDFTSVDALMDYFSVNVQTTGSVSLMRHQPNGLIISERFVKMQDGGYVGAYTDVTQIKSHEYELMDLTQKLKIQTENAQNANAIKSQFLANMSHEIRTPMNGVLGMSELLLSTEMTDSQKQFVQTIHRSGESLLKIIDEILDFSKLEAKKVTLNMMDFDILELVEDVGDLLGCLARKKGLALIIDFQSHLPRMMYGDPENIRQVLINLIGNAIKFTSKGYIYMGVRGEVLQDRIALKFIIRDTGIGIAEDKLVSIFEAFQQAEICTSHQYGGTGLGLAISRNLITLMGGDIDVRSKQGAGTVFTITMNIAFAAEKAKLDTELFDSNNALVLVAGNCQIHNKVLAGRLRMFSAKPIITSSLQDVCDLFSQARKHEKTLSLVYIDIDIFAEASETVKDRFIKETDAMNVKIVFLSKQNFDQHSPQHPDCADSTICLKPLRFGQLETHLKESVTAGMSKQRLPSHIVEPALETKKLIKNDSSTSIKKIDPMTGDNNIGYSDQSESNEILPTILIADDNLNNQMVLKFLLENYPVNLVFADNGQDALEIVLSQKINLILMDISMPVLDGLEATREIRKHEARGAVEKTPIIAVTAHTFLEDKTKQTGIEMNGFITKPVRHAALDNVISEFLGVGANTIAA